MVSVAGGKGYISQVIVLLSEARVRSVDSGLIWLETKVV